MLNSKKIVVVLPAYNAESTLTKTYSEIPLDIVDEVVLVDDNSSDETLKVAHELGIKYIIKHDKNIGYGGNQKTCYNKALGLNADIIVMLHPDYQYTPKLLPSMIWLIANDVYKVVLGSRILGKGALTGGMPLYKYFANRVLTYIENILLGQKLSEYHTGYRAFSREVLELINYNDNSNDFVFDNELISQIFMLGYEIAEITCPTKYFKEASSINFKRSVKYGFEVLLVSLKGFLHHKNYMRFKLYEHQDKNKKKAFPDIEQKLEVDK